ncbi:nucleosome-remodeling factor subunit NURF301 isoform X2 [Lutzomyia longipalpis]|uniref:nucleosome-remodeling factor subunit NURF301 isoform X2 n=1 Tax=Lutzomyia longipalpis TaxID=7200 RepID=UPI002484115D|nr:nucleosome-remodeling factor subunit NURF301 isoform X2 [Lutzomyia longipalpis]
MSGRGGKRRGRPPKTPVVERQSKFQYHLMKKPKYLLNKGSDSQMSTPSASRASSPQGSDGSRRSAFRASSSKTRRSRGGGNSGKRGPSSASSAYPRKGYESEYHYGSDFGDSTDKSDADDDPLLMSRSETDSLDDVDHESDSDFSLSSYSTNSNHVRRGPRPPSPEPLWLQARELPALELPPTSDDLLIPQHYALKVASIYEVMRRFRNLVRLSPFRIEDFCAALMCEEQSNLLAEIHMMLLKAIFREEDSQATHFGPLDQKDSVNISIYLMDTFTWPEILRKYLESDGNFDRNVLNILTTKEYPFCSVDDRLMVLQFLVDQFLITTPVRDDMLQEGPIHYDDHCRICHRLGDLLCCETCPAVFHLECVDPPLVDVPTEDWQCSICKTHKISGVMDCVSSQEKQGILCRQEHLGFDRHGRKYWFIARRLFVENEEGTEVWYYSTTKQFERVMSKLDEGEFETSLCHELNELRDEILRQMTITETLTNQHKGGKKSYLEIENATIEKQLKEENQENGGGGGEDTDKTSAADEEKKEENENTNSTDMDVDGECTNNNGASGKVVMPQKNMVTRSKTATPATTTDVKNGKNGADDPLMDTSRVTRHRLSQIASGTLYFKLGMENSFRTYVNQFTTNINALNKPQRNEERDKKRHLSHKFSLTQASEFKWIGAVSATQINIVTTLRATFLALEQNISAPYLHPNWINIRKTWVSSVANCNHPVEFSRALIVLQACMKNCIFANVWHEQLGHLKLYRITSGEREEKKKLEKREKREMADEEERNRMTYNFVKYSLGLKHQVWKQKGEEYRIHGQWSWIWMSYSRRQRCYDTVGRDRIPPQKVMTHIQMADGSENVLELEPKANTFLCNTDLSNPLNSCIPEELQGAKVLPNVGNFNTIDVSKALTSTGRLLYPKRAKKSSLDDLLQRRIQLHDNEERAMTRAKGTDMDIETSPNIPKHTISTTKQLGIVPDLGIVKRENNVVQKAGSDVLNSLTKRIDTVRTLYGQMNRAAKIFKCYGQDCNNTSNVVLTKPNSCFSPMCMQKDRVRRELLALTKRVQGNSCGVGGKKSSILEQKLTEGKFDESFEEEDYQTMIKKSLESAVKTIIEYDAEAVEECINQPIPDEPPQPVKQEDVKDEEAAKKKEEKMDVDGPSQGEDAKGTNASDTAENGESAAKKPKVEEESDQNSNSTDATTSKEDEKSGSAGEKDVECTPRRPARGRPPRISRNITTTTTTTSTKTTTKYIDGNLASYQAESTVKTQTVENQEGVRSVTTNTVNSVSGKTQYVEHHNRRFATTKTVKKEEVSKVEKEYGPNGVERVYTTKSARGRIYLKRHVAEVPETKTKPKPAAIKYPVTGNFLTKKGTRSILVLSKHELIKLARSGGRNPVAGFHQISKNNTSVWPYPCSRPLFRTCWIYRTMNVKTLSAVALQLRIMWTSLRWDDMIAKPPTTDGKHQITTETEIMSLELLKHRYLGKFMERTQYLRRKVVIPLELPKAVREVTSIRSGLRKRKRAESPQQTEPQVTEEWVDEEKLELWEIKQYGERQEKANASLPVTRQSTGKLPPARQMDIQQSSSNTSSTSSGGTKTIIVSSNATPEEIKAKMEEQLRIQRAAHNQKRAMELKTQGGTVSSGRVIKSRNILVKQPDGTTKIIQQQIVKQPETQKVQIIRTPDGKVCVKGLQPGQQLYQLPDGKIQVISSPVSNNATANKSKTLIAKALQQSSGASGSSSTITRHQVAPKVAVASKAVATVAGTTKPIGQKIQVTSNQLLTQGSVVKQVIPVATQASTVQKIITSTGQIVSSTSTVQQATQQQQQQKIVTSSNLQQLLSQTGGQKLVLSQGQGGQRILITPAGQQIAAQPGTPGQQIIVQQSPQTQTVQQPQQQQHIVINQGKVQQVIGGAQQQIIVGGQRILLNPGQRIVTSQGTQQVQLQLQTTTQVPASPTQQQQPVLAAATPTVTATSPPTAVLATPQQQQQIVIQNSNLAQQFASGKLQLATINGQQVLLRPLANNQAQIVAHVKPHDAATSTAQVVVSNTAGTPQQQQQQQVLPTVQQVVSPPTTPQKVAAPISPQTPAATSSGQSSGIVSPSIEHSLLKGQPPGTVIKCVTAQVIQTPAGPRIVLQGLANNDFTPQQLSLVQQQVKQQLLKAQESSGKQGVLGPTKIYLAVQPATQHAQPPPLAPVQNKADISSQHQSTSGVQLKSGVQVQKIVVNGAGINTDLKKGIIQKVLTGKVQKAEQQEGGDDFVNDSENPEGQSTTDAGDDGGFVVTPDYIQQTIKNALKQENLNPEIEEKLLNLQRYQERQMKHETPGQSYAIREPSPYDDEPSPPPRRKRRSSLSQDDEEWVLETPRRRPTKITGGTSSSSSERKFSETMSTGHPVAPYVGSKLRSHLNSENKTRSEGAATSPDRAGSVHKSRPLQRRELVTKRELEVKKKQQQQMQIRLYRQKELLKKDILKKRVVLEKDLQIEIQKELAQELAARANQERCKQEEVKATIVPNTTNTSKRRSGGNAAAAKKSLSPVPTSAATTSSNTPNQAQGTRTTGRTRKSTSKKAADGAGHTGSSKKKTEKLYCICRTPYDDTKFYVGCDLCNNWFHGDCVGITEEDSKKLNEFICSECKHARDTQELYCLCKQPYDESQFYICCDKCQDWFHGRCVGILQSEAEFIDEYICPNCTKNNSVNFANMKSLTTTEFENLKKLMKQITTHKNAWPFMEPVDPQEAPDYYKVIKDPMDLVKVEERIDTKWYTTLSQFIADMTKIFDNCRYYNPKESPFYKCAESLEAFFVQKIKYFRENLVDKGQ